MIDGLVISFVDIVRLKKAGQTVQAATLAAAIVNTVHQLLLVLDDNLHILTGNPAFNQAFNSKNENLTGQSLFAINESAWDCAQLRHYLTNTLTSDIAFDEYFLDARLSVLGKKRLMINGRIVKQSPGSPALILVTIQDVTEPVNLWRVLT